MKPVTPLLWPAAVGLVSLALTGWLWDHERQTQECNLRANFDFGLRQTATRIEARMTSYEQMLRGLGGLFEASDEVTAADFAHYVGALTAGADFAGLRALAFARLESPAAGPPRAPLIFLAPRTRVRPAASTARARPPGRAFRHGNTWACTPTPRNCSRC